MTILAWAVIAAAAPCPERLPVAVRLAEGADPDAVARARGAANLGPVGELPRTYLFETLCGRHDDLEDPREHHGRAARGVPLHPLVEWAAEQAPRARHTRALFAPPSDPLYGEQWHLRGGGGGEATGANVERAWEAGYTGAGACLTVVDDGLERGHPDLAPNYAAAASHDYNDGRAAPDPGSADSHGTSAAGVAAAARDGAACGVGVAYGAALAGVRLIARAATDAQEAMGLTHTLQKTDAYSCSWGPSDSGRALEGPGTLAAAAMADAVARGRGGRGAVYVWAAGNGAASGDGCEYDGYASSRHTVAVGAVTRAGRRAWYSERCAAMFVSAPSSGDGDWIATTDRTGAAGRADGDCRRDFGGTSAAAPVVAGVVALMLQANPELTHRDVQHVLAATATRADPDAASWRRNAAGRWHSDEYGFGLVDAAAATAAAAGWTGVPAERSISSGAREVGLAVPEDGTWLARSARATEDLVVEWVEVEVDATHRRRGDLELELASPSGTVATLARPRAADRAADYAGWTFSSCATWGERARGEWTLRATDRVRGTAGTLDSWKITVYGH
jgi:subtilisin family serine protease